MKSTKRKKLLNRSPAATKKLRDVLMARCDGLCENWSCFRLAAHLDHFFGRGKVPQSEETCWMLCVECDNDKTNNRPSAWYWASAFSGLCDTRGYANGAEMARARLAWLAAKGLTGRSTP